MAKLSAEYKEIIRSLPKAELELALLKLAEKRDNFDYLLVNVLDKESGESELLERAKHEIDALRDKKYKGKSTQHRLSKMLVDCGKVITRFSTNCKTKTLEVDLILYVLEKPYNENTKYLGSFHTTFDSKMALLTKKLIGVIEKKLHEDYKMEYEDRVNAYLKILHQKSNHLNSVFNLPDKI